MLVDCIIRTVDVLTVATQFESRHIDQPRYSSIDAARSSRSRRILDVFNLCALLDGGPVAVVLIVGSDRCFLPLK